MAETLNWRKLAPFGVEIDRDLSQPFTPAEADGFRALFREHGFLLARGQRLAMARQQEICGLLGPILLREGENGYMSNAGGGTAATALNWHADAAYTEHPFDALSLHALDVVDEASSTRFASAENALTDLPDSLRKVLSGREQEMIAPHYTFLAERTCDRRDPEALRRGILPAIYVNPHNGRSCVWVSELQTTRLLDMAWEDSRETLHAIYDRLYDPANVLEHRWRIGDIVIWDNVALQHARGNVEDVGNRLMQRVIVGTAGVAPHVAVN